MTREDQLVSWFKDKFAARTPPKSIQDAHPDYRVTWTEVAAEMRRLGWPGDAVAMRIEFAKIWAKHRLRAWCNKLIRATGSDVLVSKESECSKATRNSY